MPGHEEEAQMQAAPLPCRMLTDDIPSGGVEMKREIKGHLKEILRLLGRLDTEDLIKEINDIRKAIHKISPFREEPVDYIQWVKNEAISANDYNPNRVAPPEMQLLTHSIEADGYTQPIVTWSTEDGYEVVDGFHRFRIGKEHGEIRHRVSGFLPIVAINEGRSERTDRIAATIRHNRARGKHTVSLMSEIVVELKRRNWSDKKISRELGMDQDEILRLYQITGLAEMFADREFSEAWEVPETSEDEILITDEEND
jgi:hypothetical protein